MKKTIVIISAALIIFSYACKPEEVKPNNQPVNETELITTVKLLFTDSASGQTSTFMFRDPDGEGGNAPVQFDSIHLKANSTYACSILLLDESKSPTDTISRDVEEEAVDHLFVFKPSVNGLNIHIEDKDANNLPVGLKSQWRTGSANQGSVKVTLRHQPGVKDGTEIPGETDVQVDFQIKIE